MASIDMTDLAAIVFDISGTLLDSSAGTAAEYRRVLNGVVGDDTIAQITARVGDELDRRMGRISRGEEPFALEADLSRAIVSTVLAERHLRVDEDQFFQLVNVAERFDAFPGVPPQLDRISHHVPVIGLTNNTLGQVMKASARNRIRWHALLGAQLALTYKPAPAAYGLVPDILQVDPRRALFVAAHPWDLEGAARVGFRTAYLARPLAGNPGETHPFDLTVTSLDQIADLLAY